MSQHHRSQKNEKSLPERGSSGPQVPDSAAKQFLNLSALAVREKAITLFLLIAIVAAGIFAFLKLGRAEDPTFTIKVFTVAAVWPGATAQEMQDLVAEPLRQRMLHVPGVKKVDIVGERPERIFVEFSYERLATLGVSARDVFDALIRENAVTPSGSIDTKAQQVYIRLDGALDDLQKIRDTTVVSGGRTLKLSDIADVKRGYEDPATFLVRHNGQPALLLGLGLLVDDAIISIEIMVVKMEEGWDRIRAAGYAWSHTAAPMLAGTLVTVIGLMPVGFARSSAGEYAGNIFWVVGFALLTSWVVAVTFTPYLGVQMLPKIKALSGGHAAIYATPGYEKLRRLIVWAVRRKVLVACIVLGTFLVSVAGMGLVKKQFFPQSDRPELLVEVTLPQGTSIEATNASAKKVEEWLRPQPEAKIVTAYIGAGAPRFFFSYNPELPNPNFAKIIVLTANEKDRDRLKVRLRERVEQGLAPEARVRASQLVFGPY